MRNAQFLVLTGRLKEFPLYDLLETLRGQQKTGRLLVEFTAGPATFHFKRGALVDAQLGELRGAEALMLALSIEDREAAFNFNPLVTAPRAQNTGAVVPEPPRGERVVEVVSAEPSDSSAAPLPPARTQSDAYALPPAPGGDEMLVRLSHIEKALDTQSRRANVERAAYALVTVALILFAFYWRGRDAGARVAESHVPGTQNMSAPVTAVAPEPPAHVPAAQVAPEKAPEPAAGGVKRPERTNSARAQAAAAPAPQTVTAAANPPAPTPRPAGKDVQVRLTVEQGRVVRAEVSDPRPGMSAYEALALRLARQRRFPADFSGQETLRLKVGQ